MRYRIETKLNDGMTNAPAFEVDVGDDLVPDLNALGSLLAEELANDYGQPFGVGVTLHVERVAEREEKVDACWN
jgi:hypothetical protein